MWAQIKLYRKECVSDLLCFSYVCFPFHFHANDVTEYDHHSEQTVFFGVGKLMSTQESTIFSLRNFSPVGYKTFHFGLLNF